MSTKRLEFKRLDKRGVSPHFCATRKPGLNLRGGLFQKQCFCNPLSELRLTSLAHLPRYRRFDKRGVSPLIATVLLIAFAVALGAVVMSWGRSYVTEAQSNANQLNSMVGCSSVSASIPTVAGQLKLCIDQGNKVKFVLDNNGAALDGLKFTIIGDKDVDNPISLLEYHIDTAKTISESVTFDSKIGTVQQVKIIPRVVSNGKESFCTDSPVIVNNPGAC